MTTPIELIMDMDDAKREARVKLFSFSDNPGRKMDQILNELAKVIIYEKEIRRLTKEIEEWKEKYDALDKAGVLLCRMALPGETK
jgi:vacuolar-type H+-ATPase subunit D/Vma8